MAHRDSVIQRYKHGNLLLALTLLVFGQPFLGELRVADFLVEVFFFLTLVSSIVACSRTRPEALLGIALASIIMIAVVANKMADSELFWIRAILAIFFCGYVFVLLMRQILDTKRVTADTIYGALSGYLLLGLAWAFAYGLLETFVPGSYNLSAGVTRAASFVRFLGFSFVTLTTLGYGNIVPMNPRADALATTEAITGQIYLAVLLARLVALNLIQPPPGSSSPDEPSSA